MSRLLLVDNEQCGLEPLVESLGEAGFCVSKAECAISALEALRAEKFDLVLCTEELPGLDACDLLELRRSEPALCQTPLIVIATSAKNKLPAFKLGCDDFIMLPIERTEMLFRICAVLRRESKHGLCGDFSSVSIFDLIQMLIAARSSGTLEIDCGETAVFCFREGEVYHAHFRNFLGEEAFLEVLRQVKAGGSFVYSSWLKDGLAQNIHRRTDHLLISLANTLDEQGATSG